MMMLNNIINTIKNARSIAILPHISIDGDALGSSLALGMALKRLNKSVSICLEEEIPYIYNFLPGKELISSYITEQGNAYDVIVALDTGDIGRLGKRAELLQLAGKTINIDHHNTNSEYAFLNFVQTSSSAVGEIIYQVVRMMGLNLDRDISTCLYVAIATDTGGFRFSNTTALTHQITADLINNGVNVSEISDLIFDSTTLPKVKLTGLAIKSLEILENGKVAYITMTNDMFVSTGAKEEDCDGIVNIGRNIRGVEVAVMFRPKENGETRVNFRSKSYLDVAQIANFYKGGGHKKAAGCTTHGNLDDVKKSILNDIKEALY